MTKSESNQQSEKKIADSKRFHSREATEIKINDKSNKALKICISNKLECV
jgi:hypothetical protein